MVIIIYFLFNLSILASVFQCLSMFLFDLHFSHHILSSFYLEIFRNLLSHFLTFLSFFHIFFEFSVFCSFHSFLVNFLFFCIFRIFYVFIGSSLIGEKSTFAGFFIFPINPSILNTFSPTKIKIFRKNSNYFWKP